MGNYEGPRVQGVTTDALFRTAAFVAAVALVGAPYWSLAAQAGISIARAAYEAAKARKQGLARFAAAGLLVAAGWGKIPLPTFAVPATASLEVETPSDAMQQTVQPIANAIKGMPMGDRVLWAQLWSKAALVAAGDVVSTEVVFTDTKSLRAFTVLALEIGWRRIGGHRPGEREGLREAVEAAFAQVLGTAEVPVSKDLRERYAELCRAIAWAGLNAG